jgi:HK97 gp10 family phage protein
MPGRTVLYPAQLAQLLASPAGVVGRDIARRAVQVDSVAKRMCPVDTGRLRASINWRMETDSRGLLAVIGTNVEYAPYQEFGTRHMPAHPYLRPALGAARR